MKEGGILLGLMVCALVLIVAGFEGQVGSVFAVVFVPDSLVVGGGS